MSFSPHHFWLPAWLFCLWMAGAAFPPAQAAEPAKMPSHEELVKLLRQREQQLQSLRWETTVTRGMSRRKDGVPPDWHALASGVVPEVDLFTETFPTVISTQNLLDFVSGRYHNQQQTVSGTTRLESGKKEFFSEIKETAFDGQQCRSWYKRIPGEKLPERDQPYRESSSATSEIPFSPQSVFQTHRFQMGLYFLPGRLFYPYSAVGEITPLSDYLDQLQKTGQGYVVERVEADLLKINLPFPPADHKLNLFAEIYYQESLGLITRQINYTKSEKTPFFLMSEYRTTPQKVGGIAFPKEIISIGHNVMLETTRLEFKITEVNPSTDKADFALEFPPGIREHTVYKAEGEPTAGQ